MRGSPGGSARGAIEIRELVLRLPGVDRHDAHRIAEEVAARLAERLPDGVDGAPARMRLRVRVPPGARRDELAALIADQIIGSVGGGRVA